MGRKKIDTEIFVSDDKKRGTTYTKRAEGFLKKARELAALTKATVLVTIIPGKLPQSRSRSRSSMPPKKIMYPALYAYVPRDKEFPEDYNSILYHLIDNPMAFDYEKVGTDSNSMMGEEYDE